MPDRTRRRPGRNSAGAALLLSVLVHAALLTLALWPTADAEKRGATRVEVNELVVLVGDDEKPQRAATVDVPITSVEPPPAPTRSAVLNDFGPMPPTDPG